MSEIVKEKDELKTVAIKKDTWVVELPVELCESEGFAKGTLASLTFKNGAINGSYIKPSDEIDSFLDKVVEEEKEYFEEMKKLGD